MRSIKTCIFIIIISSLFFGCKKYPENKLWFKDPKKTFKGGKITAYTVNGVDKMKYFKDLYSTFPYNKYGKKIDDVFEIPIEYHSGEDEISTEYGKGSLRFSETKREIEITFTPVNADYGAENIFVSHGVTWKVMKLTKDGVLKLQGKYNFITYEIQFN